MKEIGACFSIALLLLFFSLNRFSCATETSGAQSSTEKKDPAKGLNADQMAQPDPGKDGKVNKGKDESGGSGEEQKAYEKSDSKGSGSESKDKPREESEVKGDDENGRGEVSDSKTEPLKSTYVEECDPTNQCSNEKNKLVACLRVPGEGHGIGNKICILWLMENVFFWLSLHKYCPEEGWYLFNLSEKDIEV